MVEITLGCGGDLYLVAFARVDSVGNAEIVWVMESVAFRSG